MEPRRIYRQFGAAIRERRRKLGLTQEQLAESCEMSRAALANIETGRQRVLLHHVYVLARVLELKPRELLPLQGEAAPDVIARIPLPDGLNPEQRDQIIQLLADVRLDASQENGDS